VTFVPKKTTIELTAKENNLLWMLKQHHYTLKKGENVKKAQQVLFKTRFTMYKTKKHPSLCNQ